MKKIFWLLFILFISVNASAQSESEPNNTFATADLFNPYDTLTASVGNGDAIDYFRLNYTLNKNFYLVVQATNISGSDAFLKLDMYDGREGSGLIYTKNIDDNLNIPDGATVYDTIYLCAQSIDNYFIAFTTNEEFDYQIRWLPVYPYPNDEPNNTSGLAMPFAFNATKEGSIRYIFRGNAANDVEDWYQSGALPPGNYNDVKLYLTGLNNSCAGGTKFISYMVFKSPNLATPFAQGNIGNTNNAPQFVPVQSVIPLSNMQAGDIFYVRLTSNAPFGYSLRYTDQVPFIDPEDNCCIYNAIPLKRDSVVGGNVGEYDYINDEYLDEYDTYRIILPQDGAFNIIVLGRNDQCTWSSNSLHGTILDKNGDQIDGEELLFWNNNPTCGQIKIDTIKFRGFAADTFYIQLTADEKVSYNIKYQLADSTGSDANESYNNPISTVLPISAGEVKKGHVRFKKQVSLQDPSDIYKANLPAEGSITVYLKATYRVNYNGPNNSTSGRLSFITSGFTDRTPSNPPVANMTPDGVYLDTFLICGLGAGDVYFTLSSGTMYEYEFRYVLTDTSSTDNDTEPNNTFAEATTVGGGVTKKGHVNYISNVNTDTYDYYKMIYSNSDSLKMPIQATNTSCENGKNIRIRGYNKNQVQIFTRLIANNSNVAAGQTIYDTVKIFVTAPDTIYLRLEATDAFKYEFSTNLRVPASSFTIVGDSTVCYGTETYTATNIGNEVVTYNWSLPLGGGSFTFVDSVATVTWNGSGNRSVQLYLSNAGGNSQTKTRTVVVHAALPTLAPAIYNFARTLIVNGVPSGTYVQWYRNGVVIANATDSVYYAALAGSYTAKFTNNCGPGPVSNVYSFPADVITQTITFPHTPTQSMAPVLKIKLPATASSSLPVYYTKISGPGTVTIDSLAITGVGTIIIKAAQPGNDIYSAATSKYDTIIVVKGNQVIDFPTIPDKMFRAGNFTINPTSSVGLTVTKAIISGNATISGSTIYLTGAGNITARATQAGNANYNPAPPVDRTFCVGIDTLSAIVGATTACLGTYTYTVQKIPGANYVWTLSGGGTMTTNNDTAFVAWQTTGTHTLKVKANSSCNVVFSYEPQKVITISNVVPTPVTNMAPANNAVNQVLPLIVSWVPGLYTEKYDLYVWDSAAAQPGSPYKANLTGISYSIPQLAFPYNTTYKWRVVSKTPCNQVSGPIQTFRLVPLPDLDVTSVVAPASAISGQNITISWTIKNNGPGNTLTGTTWQDAVYLSYDTLPNFSIAPAVGALAWSHIDFPLRALLLGTRTNVSALQVGQQYTNSINFSIPISYSLPVYAYVITNSGGGILEVTKVNDTARAPNPVNITLAPTPDLRVESMFTPASTFSGSTVNIAYTVKNYGSLTPPGASWQDVAYISQSVLFDSASAIKLNKLNTDGSYYPNAVAAGVTVNTQLQHDSLYSRNFDAVIPNEIFGTWFIHVKTNNTGTLYEGPLFNNNTNNNPVQVYLTPTPQLTINSLTLPVTQASTTQPIGVNWNIFNTGFNDNIERNRAHYYTKISSCVISGSAGMILSDSAGFGGSYWKDRVYLSMDSSGLNINQAKLLKELPHGIENSGVYNYQPLIGCKPGTIAGSYNKNTQNVINPGTNFPSTVTFTVPDTLLPGTWYIYVWANSNKTVFEYPGTAEIKRTSALIIQRPDAVVSSISTPANAVAGQSIQVSYAVTNNGQGTVYNHIRRDRIYVSTSAVFDASAVLFATNTFTEDLPVGTPVPHTANYTLPPALSGTRYFYVRTNFDSAFRETNANNNLSIATPTVFAPATPVDIVVSSIQTTDTVVSVFQSVIDYTLVNNGTVAATGTWTDSVFISCNAVFNPSTAFYIGRKTKSRSIPAGTTITDSFHIKIPFTYYINNCFTNYDFNNGYFFIKANADNGLYEGANTNNNITVSGLKIIDNPVVDHIITSVSGADSAIVGTTYNLSRVVKNIGRNPIIGYNNRYDSIYISVDSVLNGNAIKAGRHLWSNKLEHNQSITLNNSFSFTNVPTGYYYVIVKANAPAAILAEKNFTNNTNLIRDINGAAKKIWVTRPLLPDLRDSILSAPTVIAPGQPVTIVHRITNIGSAPSYPNSFYNSVQLTGDVLRNYLYATLSLKAINTILQPGQYRDDTVQTLIPASLTPRIYTLYCKTDFYDAIAENNETNNTAATFINVYTPEPADLTVSGITAPDTVLLGYRMDSARWIIKNNSGITAAGYSSDGIYLSQGNELDSSATLIGFKTRLLNMPPLDMDTLAHTPLVTGVTEGNYNMFIRTDLVDQIPETDETNNNGIAAAQVYVKVKQLFLNILENNTLYTDTRFYKLVIPDSLNGATISVKLTTGDSLTRVNQMFIGKGYVPTAAHFDYTYPTANYGNQEIVMAYTTAGTYYISIRTINPAGVTQNISLLARKLPFAISNVHTNSGGNIGNVTVKISGSLFAQGMTAKLNRPGTEIIASAVYFTNTTVVYATFNLQGKPLGVL